ncbi:hypothetical protein D3C72_1802280 [compost metagenome]
MVAAFQADEFLFLALAAVAPCVKTHFQGDFHGRRSVGSVKAVAKHAARQGGEFFRQLDHRFMRETGQHRVFQAVQLVLEFRIDARIRMAEQVHPPGADGVQVASAFVVIQPGAAAMADGDERYSLVVLHLRARMPHAAQTAFDPARLFFCFQNCSNDILRPWALDY